MLSDGRKMTIKFDGNNDTSSSGNSTPDQSLKINEGRLLTLTEFVEIIEAESGHVTQSVCYCFFEFLYTSFNFK